MKLVLCYHKISAERDSEWEGTTSIRNFRSHLRVIKLILLLVPGRYKKKFNILFTFDDGYSNNIEALTELNKNNLQSIIFISELFIREQLLFYWDCVKFLEQFDKNGLNKIVSQYGINDTKLIIKGISLLPTENRVEITRELNKAVYETQGDRFQIEDVQPLNEEEIVNLSRMKNVAIGLHTYSHPSLGQANKYVDYQKELGDPKKNLEHLIQMEITKFAYPFGTTSDYSVESESALRRHFLTEAWSTEGRTINRNENQLFLPRLVVGDWNAFKFISRVVRTAIPKRKNFSQMGFRVYCR